MKHVIKQGLFILFFVLFSHAGITQVIAVNYGENSYGGGEFNVGEEPTTAPTAPSDSGSSPSNNDSSDNNSEPTAPNCNDQTPGAKTPNLYSAIAKDGNSILLYFSEADDPVDHYAIEYGTKSGEYNWGSTNIGGKGSRTYLVQYLLPNQTYYFRVRAGNGCAPGEWSNEISANTKALISFNQLSFDEFELTTKTELKDEVLDTNNETSTESAEFNNLENSKKQDIDKYSVNVKVLNQDQTPVAGAKVTLHSKIQESVTNENGVVKFENVEPGEHRVLIAYNDYEGEQSLNLSGDVEEHNLSIVVTQRNVLISPFAAGIIGSLIVVIVLLLLLFWKRKR